MSKMMDWDCNFRYFNTKQTKTDDEAYDEGQKEFYISLINRSFDEDLTEIETYSKSFGIIASTLKHNLEHLKELKSTYGLETIKAFIRNIQLETILN
jgi:hypothetical protein